MDLRIRILPGINENTRVAIIGTSFIGMELAGSIMKKGPKSVDVIGMDPVPFEKILGAEVGKAIQKVNASVPPRHRQRVCLSDSINLLLPEPGRPGHQVPHGGWCRKDLAKWSVIFHITRWHSKNSHTAHLDIESDSKSVGAVELKGGDSIPADILILGVGVAPATKFLEASGFKLEKDQGITVDEYLRVQGQEDVFAIGDIAHYKQYPEKEARRVEHWNVAGNHVSSGETPLTLVEADQ